MARRACQRKHTLPAGDGKEKDRQELRKCLKKVFGKKIKKSYADGSWELLMKKTVNLGGIKTVQGMTKVLTSKAVTKVQEKEGRGRGRASV